MAPSAIDPTFDIRHKLLFLRTTEITQQHLDKLAMAKRPYLGLSLRASGTLSNSAVSSYTSTPPPGEPASFLRGSGLQAKGFKVPGGMCCSARAPAGRAGVSNAHIAQCKVELV